MSCNFCKTDIYIKTIQYSAPLLAPMTREQELRDELLNLTGEVYLPLQKRYCPMCGDKIADRKEEVLE